MMIASLSLQFLLPSRVACAEIDRQTFALHSDIAPLGRMPCGFGPLLCRLFYTLSTSGYTMSDAPPLLMTPLLVLPVVQTRGRCDDRTVAVIASSSSLGETKGGNEGKGVAGCRDGNDAQATTALSRLSRRRRHLWARRGERAKAQGRDYPG